MSGKKIRGITVEIGGDVSGLNKALETVNKKSRDTQAQLRDVQKLLKLDPTNTELLRQKQQLLTQAVSDTKEKLDVLRKTEQQLKDSGVEENSAQFMAVRREIISTTDELEELEDSLNRTSNIKLQAISAQFDELGDKADVFAQKTAGISKAAAGVLGGLGVIAGKAVKGYSEYEQLIGGTELLYGAAYEDVAAKARDAYKTVQLSQSEYLEQVNGFATGLKTALNGDERAAADLADKIVTAEADVVAATGASQDAIQNAFNGIMKGNYQMLDNLQLGITPTKEGFQEVIDKVNEWNAANGRATSYQMDNLADAESALVDYIEMQGLAGYAAQEASETIAGSYASAKSAVDNLITGLGDADADVDELVSNVIESSEDVINNLLPVLETIWNHIPDWGKISIGVLGVLALLSPVAAGISNITGAISGVIDVWPHIAGIAGKVWAFVAANPLVLIGAAVVALVALIALKGDQIQAILQKVDDFMQGIFATDFTKIFGPVLGSALNAFFANVKNVWDSVMKVFNGIIDFIRGVFTGDWSRAWNGIKSIFSGIFSGLTAIAKAPLNAIIGLLNGLIGGANSLIGKLNSISITPPKWVTSLTGIGSFGFNLAYLGSIPYLANGGILSRGSAVVGEAGPELLTMSGGGAVVQPLTNNTTHHRSTYLGGMTVNVYAAPGQDEDAIAEKVLEKAQQKYEEEAVALA